MIYVLIILTIIFGSFLIHVFAPNKIDRDIDTEKNKRDYFFGRKK